MNGRDPAHFSTAFEDGISVAPEPLPADYRPHWFELGYDGYDAREVDEFLYALGDATAAGKDRVDLAVLIRDMTFSEVENGYDPSTVDTYLGGLRDSLAGTVIVLD